MSIDNHPGFLDLSDEHMEIFQNYHISNSQIINVKQNQVHHDTSCYVTNLSDCILSFLSHDNNNESKFYLPQQLKNVNRLIIDPHDTIRPIKQLASIKGLPLQARNVTIKNQKLHLDLEKLEYYFINALYLINSTFKNFDFVKKWNPEAITVNTIDFKNFKIFNENVKFLNIIDIKNYVDFSDIKLLKNLSEIRFIQHQITNKEFFVNIIQLLTLNVIYYAEVRKNDIFNGGELFDIIKKYFNKTDRKQYMMDCLLELLDNDYINAGG